MSLKGKNDKWVDWNDKQALQTAISNSTSKADTLRTLGYSHSGPSIEKLSKAIKKFDLDVTSFNINAARWEELPNIFETCSTMSELLEKLGLRLTGGNRRTAKKYIKKFKLDVNHLDTTPGKRKYSYEDLFCENCTIHRGTVKSYILRENLIEYKCAKCGNGGEWLNEKLVLQLEHINGINNDNRLENLTFLCPNCHTQTPTFGGRKQK